MAEPVSIADLKTMLGVTSDSYDAVLTLIISNTGQALRFKLGLKQSEELPAELAYIVLEVCIRRFNRRKNEGMSSYSQEGESMTFNSNDFDDFADDIAQWKADNAKNANTLGSVAFISGHRGKRYAPRS